MIAIEDELAACGGIAAVTPDLMLTAKQHGFSDRQLSNLWGTTDTDVRSKRKAMGVEAVFKSVDTCAAEFEAYTPYYYSTYERRRRLGTSTDDFLSKTKRSPTPANPAS